MVVYALLNRNNYCIGMSELASRIENEHMIEIESWDDSYLRRKYDRDQLKWTEDYMEIPNVEQKVTLESIKNDIGPMKDTLTLTSDDTLIIMEYQTMLDEKLNRIIEHLGL